MSAPPFAHLVVRSPWSFRRGASSLEELGRVAAERGVAAVGIVDDGGPWAAPLAWLALARSGVKPLIGAELQGDDGTAWVLARNDAGFRALSAASSALATGAAARVAPLLGERSAGLIVLCQDEGLLPGLAEVLPARRLRVALTPSGTRSRPVALARRLGLVPVAVGDVHFASAGQRDVHRLLRASVLRAHPARVPDDELAPADAWLLEERRMRQAFRDLPDAVDEAGRIAASCTLDLPRDRQFGQPRHPDLARLGIDDAVRTLAARARAGLRERGVDDPAHRDQLVKELSAVDLRGSAPCYLVVADLVDFARGRGIAWCGRGAAAGTLLAHAIGLTEADPLALGLLSERALGSGASGSPDLDLDLDGRRREEVLRHVAERHGAERVANIGTHVVFGARGALRELGKLLGLPETELAAVGRAIHGRLPATLPEVLARHPRLRRVRLDSEPWRLLLDAVRTVQDFPRHASVHPGGLVIGPGPLSEIVPLFRSTGGDVATQWEAEEAEAAGLFRVDLLGNRALGVLEDARRMILADGAPDPRGEDPMADGATVARLRAADTFGCYQVESPGTRAVLRDMGCASLDELMVATAIVRPGVAGSGMMRTFLERRRTARRGGAPRAPAPLTSILPEHHGVLVYQDDVITVARELTGMEEDEAQALLGALNGRDRSGHLPDLRRRFLDGAREAGLDDAQVRTLWRQVGAFAGFGLSRTQAANHALLSARAIHLRGRHPAAFMAAVLGYPGGAYSPAAYLSEARRMGLRLRPPAINRSGRRTRCAGEDVLLGLYHVLALQPGSARAVVEQRRRHGPYRSLDDLMARLPLSALELDGLIRCGALDACADGRTRAGLLWLRVSLSARGGTHAAGPQLPLQWSSPAPGSDAPAESRLERMMLEHQSMGLIVSGHPLELFGPFLPIDRIRAEELPRHLGERVELAGWKVSMRTIRTRRGEIMEQGAFEDETALYDVVLLPDVLRRFGNELTRGGPFLVRGVVRDEPGPPSIVVRELRLIADPGKVDGERAGTSAVAAVP